MEEAAEGILDVGVVAGDGHVRRLARTPVGDGDAGDGDVWNLPVLPGRPSCAIAMTTNLFVIIAWPNAVMVPKQVPKVLQT